MSDLASNKLKTEILPSRELHKKPRVASSGKFFWWKSKFSRMWKFPRFLPRKLFQLIFTVPFLFSLPFTQCKVDKWVEIHFFLFSLLHTRQQRKGYKGCHRNFLVFFTYLLLQEERLSNHFHEYRGWLYNSLQRQKCI